ncbi:MAG: DivIVA domain-containing protein [Syntrophomonadaceae bacterium]|nr:DivIVA domain-containing protein [Syntrophomonadaceae bacterium]
MITAIEIRNQQFKKSFRGYNEEEVKNFLLRLAEDYETLYGENSQLKEDVQKLQYELGKYYKLEDTMNNSLILAQQTAEELKENARKEADLILQNAKQRITEILAVYQEVIKRLNMLTAELKAQVGGEMEFLEKNQQKIEELSRFFYSKDLKELMENLGKIELKEE